MPWSEFAHMPQHLVSLKLCKPWPFNLFMTKSHIHNMWAGLQVPH